MEWGNKFSTLMKDTELNLQKVKDRLASTRTTSTFTQSYLDDRSKNLSLNSTDMLLGSYSKPVTKEFMSSAPGTSPYQSLTSPIPPMIPQIPPVMPQKYNDTSAGNYLSGTALEPSSGVLLVLCEKLDNQAQQIKKLTDSMRQIEEERDQYHRQVRTLKGDLVSINTRISEKGVDLATEKKIDSWRQGMMSEVRDLQAQFQYLRGKNEELDLRTSNTDLHRELQDMKRTMHTDFGLMHREVESMKTRLLALEVAMEKTTVKNMDLNDRQKRLETGKSDILSPIKESQEQSSYFMSVASLHNYKQTRFTSDQDGREISDLRNNINVIAHKLTNLEDSVKPGTSENRKKAKISTVKPQSSDLTLDSEFDLSSTVDFSDLNTADLLSSPKRKGNVTDNFDDLTADTEDLLSTDDLTTDGKI